MDTTESFKNITKQTEYIKSYNDISKYHHLNAKIINASD